MDFMRGEQLDVDRLMEQFADEAMPSEVQQLATEMRLVKMHLATVDRQLAKVEDALMETPEYKALLHSYLDALTACGKAMAANTRIGEFRQRLVDIAQERVALTAQMRNADNRDALFQTVRDLMQEERRLNEDIATETSQDEAILKSTHVRTTAAVAVMSRHAELLAQNAQGKALAAERDLLLETERSLREGMLATATSLGLMPQPMNRGREREDRADGRHSSDLPLAQDPVGLDAF
jgi:uncharacterized protein YjaG (DUF416 family)